MNSAVSIVPSSSSHFMAIQQVPTPSYSRHDNAFRKGICMWVGMKSEVSKPRPWLLILPVAHDEGCWFLEAKRFEGSWARVYVVPLCVTVGHSRTVVWGNATRRHGWLEWRCGQGGGGVWAMMDCGVWRDPVQWSVAWQWQRQWATASSWTGAVVWEIA